MQTGIFSKYVIQFSEFAEILTQWEHDRQPTTDKQCCSDMKIQSWTRKPCYHKELID